MLPSSATLGSTQGVLRELGYLRDAGECAEGLIRGRWVCLAATRSS